jgi:hypothetical protein
VSTRLKYATVGVLFVNISIGGTLTSFAAPPVLMVAATWQLGHALHAADLRLEGCRGGTCQCAGGYAACSAANSPSTCAPRPRLLDGRPPVPQALVIVHLAFLAGVVLFAHHPPAFLGCSCSSWAFATAYERHQNPLILREALLVAFFLAGLVVLGGLQQWWLQPLLMGMDATPCSSAPRR